MAHSDRYHSVSNPSFFSKHWPWLVPIVWLALEVILVLGCHGLGLLTHRLVGLIVGIILSIIWIIVGAVSYLLGAGNSVLSIEGRE